MSSDHDDIVALTVKYCWSADTHQWDELATVFTEDATAKLGSTTHNSRAEIVDRIRNALTPLDCSQHMVSNHQVTVTGDTATSRCYLLAQHIRTGIDGGHCWLVGGTYEDNYARTEDGWRIERRVLTTLWHDGNRNVLNR